MNLLTQPSKDAKLCMLYSFAMCLDITPEELSLEIGTSTHWQEFIEPCLKRGFIPILVDFFPTTKDTPKDEAIWPFYECMDKMSALVYGRRAVLITESHAVAYEDSLIYDSAVFTESESIYPFHWNNYQKAVILIPESNQH